VKMYLSHGKVIKPKVGTFGYSFLYFFSPSFFPQKNLSCTLKPTTFALMKLISARMKKNDVEVAHGLNNFNL